MEQSLQVLEAFFKELNKYVQTCEEDERWIEEEKHSLEQKQMNRKDITQNSINEKKQTKKAQRLQLIQAKEAEEQALDNQVNTKKQALQSSINRNNTICKNIEAWKEKIENPDYFRYEKEYAAYGDFFPEITSLEDFKELDFERIVEVINTKKTNTLLAKVRLKLGDDNLLVEYASFCNLLSKARYLCDIENEALEKKGNSEIQILEDQLTEIRKAHQILTVQMQQSEQREEEEYQKTFYDLEQTERLEKEDLKNATLERRRLTNERFRQILAQDFSVERLQGIYTSLEKNRLQAEKTLLSDGLPFQIHLAKLWMKASELLKIEQVMKIVKMNYDFMLSEEQVLVLPGIFG